MIPEQNCPRCGQILALDAPAGHCPKCLVHLAMEAAAAETSMAITMGTSPASSVQPSRGASVRVKYFGDYETPGGDRPGWDGRGLEGAAVQPQPSRGVEDDPGGKVCQRWSPARSRALLPVASCFTSAKFIRKRSRFLEFG